MITKPFAGQRVKIRSYDLFTVPYAKCAISHEEYMAGKTFYGTVIQCDGWEWWGMDAKVSVNWDDHRIRHTRLAVSCLLPVTPDEDIILAVIEQGARDDFAELRQQFME